MLNTQYEIYTKRNAKADDKPNEDYAVFNDTLGIGMVLDGVSRDRENGKYPNPSPAEVASHLFSESILEYVESSKESGVKKISSAINYGNKALKRYNNELMHRFPAGTVGIVFSIEKDILHYGYIGDCYAAIIRNELMGVFTECQTSMVTGHKMEYTSDEIRFDICNHINHPCGYGVWDGNENAMDFVKYGTIMLRKGDILLMYSDGFASVVRNIELLKIVDIPLENLFGKNEVNQDDATCLKIIIKE